MSTNDDRRKLATMLRVRRGIELCRELYGDEPGILIDADTLDQSNQEMCLLAQWSGRWYRDSLPDLYLEGAVTAHPAHFGFEVFGGPEFSSYEELTAICKQQLKLYQAGVMRKTA